MIILQVPSDIYEKKSQARVTSNNCSLSSIWGCDVTTKARGSFTDSVMIFLLCNLTKHLTSLLSCQTLKEVVGLPSRLSDLLQGSPKFNVKHQMASVLYQLRVFNACSSSLCDVNFSDGAPQFSFPTLFPFQLYSKVSLELIFCTFLNLTMNKTHKTTEMFALSTRL